MSTNPPTPAPAPAAGAAPDKPAEGAPVEGAEDDGQGGESFPPYPPYAPPAPPSVADAVIAGVGLRRLHKAIPKKSVRPLPRPARPKYPKATDVKMTRQAMQAHARCLRKHGAVLTDRLEFMAKPRRRNIICLWRENADTLPADTIARLRNMLDADEPFNPDQAYAYFVNLKKTKQKQAALERARLRALKKDIASMCSGKKFTWARNAAVAFARGVQQRLSKPGGYVLTDGMLRLSDIILSDICGFMKIKRIPSRHCPESKAEVMMEVSDKVAVWIDEILSESDDRMLMMDFDEDDDVAMAARGGGLHGDGGDGSPPGTGVRAKREERPAHLKFEGDMKKAFEILTDEMEKKGDDRLLTIGKFKQTYQEGSDELKRTTDLKATHFNAREAEKVHTTLTDLTKPVTPSAIAPAMADMLEICANYLAQNAEYSKDKGPAFKLLLKLLNKKPRDKMYEKGKIKRTQAQAAKELSLAKGLESDHDDPDLSACIYRYMQRVVYGAAPKEMREEMEETIDRCSKYLSQKAVDDNERGPAFDLLVKELESQGDTPFCDYPPIATTFATAYVLRSAPGLESAEPDPKTVDDFRVALHRAVDTVTPKEQKSEMSKVIDGCSNYLSAFKRDRGAALAALLAMAKSNPQNVVAERDGYTLDYETAANEIENAPTLVPFLPIKDIADEGKDNFTRDMQEVTPEHLQVPMQALIKDSTKHLSQVVALRSGAAGERYNVGLLSAVKKSIGTKPLYKYKSYGKTYSDAAEDLDTMNSTVKPDLTPEGIDLGKQITSEMKRGIPTKLTPTVTADLAPAVEAAGLHLAKQGVERGEAMDYVVTLMKDRGDEKLANLQGYDQTYDDGARRLVNTPTLRTDTVDVGAYSTVKTKLTEMTEKEPEKKYENVLPEILDDAANFLAKPIPETNAEKKQVLADLMSREGDKIFADKKPYKITFKEAGEDIKNSPVGVTKAHDDEKKEEIHNQIKAIMPDEKMGAVLKDSADEGAAYLTDAIEGRGEALKIIQKKLEKEGQKDFVTVGKFEKDHAGVAQMMAEAPNFKSDKPSPVILEHVEHRLDQLPSDPEEQSQLAKEHMKDMTEITAKYVATKATEECGLDAQQLAELDDQGFNEEAKAAAEKRRLAAIAALAATGAAGLPGETADQRRRRIEAERKRKLEEEKRKKQEEKERLRRLAEEERIRRETGKYRGGALGADYDPEHTEALDILHQELQAHGPEVLYQQPQTTLTHGLASDWLSDPDPMKVDKSVKDSAETARLHKKFEKKFTGIVKDKTPPKLDDAMQDVVIEGSRKTAEYFVKTNYGALVNEGLVTEMQKRGSEVLVEVDGKPETNFFAAQRIKRKDPAEYKEPNYKISPEIAKKLDDVVRSHPLPRKVQMTVKDHIKGASKYLSAVVTKPDEYIEAYVALLGELDANDELTLIEGDTPKTCNQSSKYLRGLTTFKDTIGLPNSALNAAVKQRLTSMMSHAPPSTKAKFNPAVMTDVIAEVTNLLVSYVMLQAAKNKALEVLVKEMDEAGEPAMLRHGAIRKSFREGANVLQGKTTNDLSSVTNADPVVTRKINVKLTHLMLDNTPPKYEELMPGVIEEATKYLAVRLLEPRVIKVCKCFKNVFVQCELWCDEILRRVARPCCTCERQVSVQALQDLAPTDFLTINEDKTRAFAPGVEISFNPCPNQSRTPGPVPYCPAHKKTTTTSYLLYSTTHKKLAYCDPVQPSASSNTLDYDSMQPSPSTSSPEPPMSLLTPESPFLAKEKFSPPNPLVLEMHDDKVQFIRRQQEELKSFEARNQDRLLEEMSQPSFSSASNYNYRASPSLATQLNRDQTQQFSKPISDQSSNTARTEYSSRTPIVATEHTVIDWDATMVSLLWNVLAWRDWIQDIVDHSLSYQYSPSFSRGDSAVSWVSFYNRVTMEALHWRQYSLSSRKLTTRLHMRYRDKEVKSPVRSNVKTKTYLQCQLAMLDIIDMFNRWTQWLNLVVKETDSLQQTRNCEVPLHVMRWNHLKTKVEGYSEDWLNYNKFLKVSWERKYRAVIADYLPSMDMSGPVWVVSTCGAVPSGAVAAGVYDNEVIWVARALHKCVMLPATLLTSKHCCLVYADGQVHSYTKYQVMCNAEVHWVAWRGGSVHECAVSVAPGMYVGRVHYHGDHLLGAVYEPSYHCHVVIFGRPFAFNCYELLMLAADDSQ